MQYIDVVPDFNSYYESCWSSWNTQQNNLVDTSSQTYQSNQILTTSVGTSPILKLAHNDFIEWNKKIQTGNIKINSSTSPINFINTNNDSTDTNDLPCNELIHTSSYTQTKYDLLLHALKLWQPFVICKNILISKGLSSFVCYAIGDNQYVNLGSYDSFEDE